MNKDKTIAFATGMFAGIILTSLLFGAMLVMKSTSGDKPRMGSFIDAASVSPANSVIGDRTRYFFVSYSTRGVGGNTDIFGDSWFTCNGFPRKSNIDSIIYERLIESRECYMHIIILGMFEFKDSTDYYDFTTHYRGDPKPEKQLECCAIGDGLRVIPFDSGWRRANGNDYIDSSIQLYKPDMYIPDTLSYWYKHRGMDSIMLLYHDLIVPGRFDTAWISDNGYRYTIDNTKP